MSLLKCQIQRLTAELAVLRAQAEARESARRLSGQLYKHILDTQVATRFCIQPIDELSDWPRDKFEIEMSPELKKLFLDFLEAKKNGVDQGLEPTPLNIL